MTRDPQPAAPPGISEDARRTLADYAPMLDAYADDADRDPLKVAFDRPTILAMAGDLRGKRVLDAGCATGALAVALADRGAQVVGISVDGVDTQRKFKDRHGLPFPLLSDEGGKVSELYSGKMPLVGLSKRANVVIE